MSKMDHKDTLEQNIAIYNSLQTEQDKRDFLNSQRQKIARMTLEQRQSHQAAIAQEVSRIAQQVEKNRRSATA